MVSVEVPKRYKRRLERVLELREQSRQARLVSMEETAELGGMLSEEGLTYAKIGELLGGISRQRVFQVLMAGRKRAAQKC